MKSTRGRVVDIETVDDLDRRLAEGATNLAGWRLRSLDLTDHSRRLREVELAGASFLGCTFSRGDAERAAAEGALVLPFVPDSPVHVDRATLYSPEELYDAPVYERCLDGRAYAWSQGSPDTKGALARTLHDHALDQALATWVEPRRIAGVMGGHRVQRGEPAYADAARLAQALAERHVVATGGGPGAMEAANLGAWLHGVDHAGLTEALALLDRVPRYRPSVEAWVGAAFEVRERFPGGRESLGIPTWHYGHEPPNVFATDIAKYFRNAMREAILLQVCDSGIVFLPGSAGTVQEVFQDACENYYADDSAVAPMVLLGADYWTDELPAWPLLQSLARGTPMEEHVHLVDSVEEAVDVVLSRP